MHAIRHDDPRPQRLPACVAGLRRVEEVRVFVGGSRPIAEVTGIAHRSPQTFRVSLAAAVQLCDAGVPLRIAYVNDPCGDGAASDGRLLETLLD